MLQQITKLVFYISLVIWEKYVSFRDLLKIIGIADEIGDMLQHLHLLNYFLGIGD